jgi:hypothetical protein
MACNRRVVCRERFALFQVIVQLVSYLSDDVICFKQTAHNFTGASCLSTLASRGNIQQLCFKIVVPFQASYTYTRGNITYSGDQGPRQVSRHPIMIDVSFHYNNNT